GSSDVCSSDLVLYRWLIDRYGTAPGPAGGLRLVGKQAPGTNRPDPFSRGSLGQCPGDLPAPRRARSDGEGDGGDVSRSAPASPVPASGVGTDGRGIRPGALRPVGNGRSPVSGYPHPGPC